MADKASDIIGKVLNNNPEGGEAVLNIDGLEEKTSSTDNIRNAFQEVLQEFYEKFKKEYSEIFETLHDKKGGKGAEGARNDKAEKAKDRPTVTDVLALDKEYALGSLLLYYKLDAIHETLKGTDKKGEESGKAGSIGDVFKGMLKGVAGIALLGIALIAFAGALMIFSGIEWDDALKGMLAFSVFTIGMILMSKLMGDEEKAFLDFAKASLLMSAGIIVFAVSIYLINKLQQDEDYSVIKALPTIGLFVLFIAGIALVSRITKSEQDNFKDFAVGVMYMVGGLTLFAGLLYLLNLPIFEWGMILNSMGKVTLIGAFLIGVGLLTNFMEEDKYRKFAVSTMVMTGAFLLFGALLYIFTLPFFEWINMVQSIAKVGLISVLLVAVGKAANAIDEAKLWTFSLSAVILAAGFLVWAAAIYVFETISWGMLLNSLAKMGVIGLILFAVAGLGYASVPAIIGLSLFGVATALMAGVFLLLAGALSSFNLVASYDLVGINEKVGQVNTIVQSLASVGGVSLIGMAKMAGLAIWAAAAVSVFKNVEKVINAIDTVAQKDLSSITTTLSVIKTNVIDELANVGDIGIRQSLKMAAFSLAMLPMLLAVNGIIDLIERMDVMVQQGFKIENVQPFMDKVMGMFASFVGLADKSKATIEQALAFTIGLKGITDSFDNTINAVEKISNLEKELIDRGTINLNYLVEKVFSPEGSIMNLFNTIQNTGTISVESAQALPLLVDAVDKSSGLVIKINDIPNVEQGIQKSSALSKLVAQLYEDLTSMTGWFKSGSAKIQAAGQTVDELVNIIPKLVDFGNGANTIPAVDINQKFGMLFPKASMEYLQHSRNMKESFQEINKGFTALSKQNNISLVATSMERIASVRIGSALNPLITLANNASALQQAASAIRDIANANADMSGSQESGGLLGGLFGKKKEANQESAGTGIVIQGSGVSSVDYTDKFDILIDSIEEMKRDGLLVRSVPSTAHKEEIKSVYLDVFKNGG